MTANSPDSLFLTLGEADYSQLSQWLTDERVLECDDSRQKSAFLRRSFGR